MHPLLRVMDGARDPQEQAIAESSVPGCPRFILSIKMRVSQTTIVPA